MAEEPVGQAEPDLLQEYLDQDPRKLSGANKAKAARVLGISIGEVEALIKQMGVAWEEVDNA